MIRGRWVLAWALVAAVALAACGGSAHHRSAHRQMVTVVPRSPTTRATTTTTASPPALVALQRSLAKQLKAAGPGSGAVVYDLTAGRQLFWLRGALARPPASVEKLYTTIAVLKDLGPDTQLTTRALGTGHLASGSVWRGNLYLRGAGDPTFGDGTFNQIWEEGYGPTPEQLVAQLRRAGVRRVSGRVIGDSSLFDSLRGGPNSGYAPDIPDLGGQLSALTYDHGATDGRLSPAAFAVHELVLTMRRSGIRAKAARFTATAPPGAQSLASVNSPPISVLVKLMDVPSDDFFAEMLTKQLGARFGGAGSTAQGAVVITDAIVALGVHPVIVDGSGLSRRDASSPLQVIDLLRAVWGTPAGRILTASLPVVGVSGTTRPLAVHTPAQGNCVAKTGSLNYVTNLAGYCHSRGGHTLAFALFLDGPSNARAFMLIGRMVAAIARY